MHVPASHVRKNNNVCVQVSWGEARAFCRVLGGDLLTFKSVNHFTTVIKHLQDHREYLCGAAFRLCV